MAVTSKTGNIFIGGWRGAASRLTFRAEEERKACETAPQSGTPYGMQRIFLLSPKGGPCTAPPWGLVFTGGDAGSAPKNVRFRYRQTPVEGSTAHFGASDTNDL